jgi:hypothetical protein
MPKGKQRIVEALEDDDREALERALCALVSFEGPVKDALAEIGRPTVALHDVCAALRHILD